MSVLKSQGVVNPESYLQKIVQTYPKFAPILSTKIPQNLISVIWNDPVTKQIASIFSSNKQVRDSLKTSKCSLVFDSGTIKYNQFFDETKVGEVFLLREIFVNDNLVIQNHPMMDVQQIVVLIIQQ